MPDLVPHNDMARKRMKHAMEQVLNFSGSKQGNESDYLSYAQSLPATIRANGLGQALAMLRQRGASKGAYKSLYDHISAWFQHEDCPLQLASDHGGDGDLIKAVVKANQRDYLNMQAEALLYAEWLKKFANAFLDQPASAAVEGPQGEEGRE